MLRERRRIWLEDFYRPLSFEGDHVYCGRKKGERYQIFRRSLNGSRRMLLQEVPLDRDWFWNSTQGRLIESDLQTSPALLARREEDILAGYCWFEDGERRDRVSRIEDLSLDVVSSEFTLPTGATGFVLRPHECRRWLVSLHGGPESVEGREIRYGGFYRELLRSGTGVIVLNYVGSSGHADGVLKQAWGRWRQSILSDVSALLDNDMFELPKAKEITLFGASFGGALALSLQLDIGFERLLLASPLLDLTSQMKRAVDQQEWFHERFSQGDEQHLSFRRLSQASGAISMIYGEFDEVLGCDEFERIRVEKPNWTVRSIPCGHAPVRYTDCRSRLEFLMGAMNSLAHRSAENVEL